MKTLHLDYETRSNVDLRKTGITPYIESIFTDISCAAFAFGSSEIELWKRGQAIPQSIVNHVREGGLVAAHNAAFELAVWNGIWVKREGLPILKPEQVYCTMAKAYAMGLPGSLANVAPALGLEERKDSKGGRVMLQLARPKKILADGTPIFMEEFEYPEKFDTLYEYCKQDVIVEREVDKRLMSLSKSEQKLWVLDQKINNRGIKIDVKACEAALNLVKADKKKLDDKMKETTNNFVAVCSEVSRLKQWLLSEGIDCKGVAKDDIKAMLSLPNLPTNVKRALRLRQLAGKTSTAKLDSMLKRVGKNGRVLQTLQFHGANTGRWAARGVQFQNVPRPVISQNDIEQIFDWLLTKKEEEAAELITIFYGDITTAISSCLRGMVIGDNLICGDWSAIEARVLAWLAGQESILEVFRKDGKIYEKEAAGIYGIRISNVDKEQRQIGKVATLSLGYQGGKKAFQAMAKNYGVKVTDERAEEIKERWRGNNQRIVAYWSKVERAAFLAVQTPGMKYRVGDCTFLMKGSFLWCQLPSGRCICYPYPKLEKIETPWGAEKQAVTYMGTDALTKKWVRKSSYGGLITENITQAVARDILSECMTRLEDKGYPVVMHVHDEIVCELANPDIEFFENEMKRVPSWAKGLPLEAEAWIGHRYRK